MNNVYAYINFSPESRRAIAAGIGKGILGWFGGRIADRVDSLAATSRARRMLSRQLRDSPNGTLSISDLIKNKSLGEFHDYVTRDGYTTKGYRLPDEITRDDIGRLSRDIGRRIINYNRTGYQDPNMYERLGAMGSGVYKGLGRIKEGIRTASLYDAYRSGDRRAGVQLAMRKLSESFNPYLAQRAKRIQEAHDQDSYKRGLDYRNTLLNLRERERSAGVEWKKDSDGVYGYHPYEQTSSNPGN